MTKTLAHAGTKDAQKQMPGQQRWKVRSKSRGVSFSRRVFVLRACLCHRGPGSYVHFCRHQSTGQAIQGTTLTAKSVPCTSRPWRCRHCKCAIAKGLDRFHGPAHAAQSGQFSSASTPHRLPHRGVFATQKPGPQNSDIAPFGSVVIMGSHVLSSPAERLKYVIQSQNENQKSASKENVINFVAFFRI